MFTKKAFSMIEVMCAICIFALAVLPLIWLSSSQTKTAYSASKHLMAGQLAASYMDNLLKRPFKELYNLSNIPTKKVLEDSNDNNKFILKNLINKLTENTEFSKFSAKDNIEASFKNFKYSIIFDKNKDTTSKIYYVKITVKVSYQVIEGNDKTKQDVELRAIKFGEKNG